MGFASETASEENIIEGACHRNRSRKKITRTTWTLTSPNGSRLLEGEEKKTARKTSRISLAWFSTSEE